MRSEPRPSSGRLGRVLREPVVHFAALAVLLFAIDAFSDRQGSADVVEIDLAKVHARIMALEVATGTALSDEDRRRVREAYVDEQILVREALALGLEEDARIHDFLAQKMLHVLSADVIQPSDGELERFFDANRARYASPAVLSVDELVVNSSAETSAGLLQQLQAGIAPERLSISSPHRTRALTDISVDDLVALFDESTARRVFEAEVGSWVGPHETEHRKHWFRVTARTEEALPELDSMREQVRLDWVREQEDVRLEGRVRELRQQYEVVFTGEGYTP